MSIKINILSNFFLLQINNCSTAGGKTRKRKDGKRKKIHGKRKKKIENYGNGFFFFTETEKKMKKKKEKKFKCITFFNFLPKCFFNFNIFIIQDCGHLWKRKIKQNIKYNLI